MQSSSIFYNQLIKVPVLKHLNLCKTNLFSVCRLLPWHCWACLWPRWTCLLNWSYYLQRTEEIERRKVSLGKPSCSSSSRSIARPRRPQKSIKYVGVTGLLSLSQKLFLPLRAVLINSTFPEMLKKEIKSMKLNNLADIYFDPFLYLSPLPLWKPPPVLKGSRRWSELHLLITN